MIRLPAREHRRLVAIHGWTGVGLGLLLYVVVATGTVAVLAREIGAWSSGTLATRAPLSRALDAAVGRAIADAPPNLRDTVDLSAAADDRLAVSLRGPAGPDARGIDLDVAPDGAVLRRRDGPAADIEDADPPGALAAFLVDLHVRLYVPAPWGYTVTGVAGLALLAAALSGFAIHRHLLKDIFTLRRGARPGLTARDRHNMAGAWALPFAVVLAVTGSVFSWSASAGFPALAWMSYGGDREALFAALAGPPPPADPAPAPRADLDAVMADAAARAGAAPTYVRLARPGRADARITVYAAPPAGALTGHTLVYDGASGTLLEDRRAYGRVASVGGTLYGLMAPLHFGDFAGPASKVAWAVLGLCSCVATLGGIRLWLARRDDRASALLDRCTAIVGLGLPFATAGAAAGFFAGLPGGGGPGWTEAGFLAAAAAATVAGIALPRRRVGPALSAATGIGLALLPALRWAAGGPGWGAALAAGRLAVPSGDVAVLAIAAAFLWTAAPAAMRDHRPLRPGRAVP